MCCWRSGNQSVPLKMIKEAVAEAAESYSYEGSLKVIISAPKGVDIAKKTFNPNLGITGAYQFLEQQEL